MEKTVSDSIELSDSILARGTPGGQLEAARFLRDMTQARLSGLTRIPVKNISEMENGKRVISKADALAFAKALKLDPETFLNT